LFPVFAFLKGTKKVFIRDQNAQISTRLEITPIPFIKRKHSKNLKRNERPDKKFVGGGH
jgi:hypothetical protein